MTNITTGVSSSASGFAAGLRGFGPLGLVPIILIVAGVMVGPPVSAVLVLLWVWLSKTPWRDIGFVRPRSWAATIVFGILFGIAFKFLMKAVVMPRLGAPPMNEAFQYLAGNPTEALSFAAYAIVGAGFSEETVFRGWTFERLGKLLGGGAGAKIVIVIVTAALFGIAHYTGQGWTGVEQAAIVGVVFGAIFAVTGRLIPLMVAHAAFDLTALWMIYFGYETRIAHLVLP